MNPHTSPQTKVDENIRDASQEDESGSVSVRINQTDHDFLMTVKGKMMIEEKQNVTFRDVIHQMVIKWDSLIKSYEALKSLPPVEE